MLLSKPVECSGQRVDGQHGAVNFARRQGQRGLDGAVIEGTRRRHSFAAQPFRQPGTGGDGRGAAVGLETGVRNHVPAQTQVQADDSAGCRRAGLTRVNNGLIVLPAAYLARMPEMLQQERTVLRSATHHAVQYNRAVK